MFIYLKVNPEYINTFLCGGRGGCDTSDHRATVTIAGGAKWISPMVRKGAAAFKHKLHACMLS